jgi:hypothetical protein
LKTADTTPPKEPAYADLANEDDEMWPGMVIIAPCGCGPFSDRGDDEHAESV